AWSAVECRPRHTQPVQYIAAGTSWAYPRVRPGEEESGIVMSPKPLRNGMSGWLGRRTARLRSLAVVGTVTLGLAGIGIAAAGPPAAHPAPPYPAPGAATLPHRLKPVPPR